MKKFPDSLRTATPSEGHTLARQMAEIALDERSAAHRDMAAHLSDPPAPSIEALTAAYFQAVAVVNDAWRR